MEAKFRTNILIIERLMLTKDIKTTKSDLVINKRLKNEANGQPVCTIDANVECKSKRQEEKPQKIFRVGYIAPKSTRGR